MSFTAFIFCMTFILLKAANHHILPSIVFSLQWKTQAELTGFNQIFLIVPCRTDTNIPLSSPEECLKARCWGPFSFSLNTRWGHINVLTWLLVSLKANCISIHPSSKPASSCSESWEEPIPAVTGPEAVYNLNGQQYLTVSAQISMPLSHVDKGMPPSS